MNQCWRDCIICDWCIQDRDVVSRTNFDVWRINFIKIFVGSIPIESVINFSQQCHWNFIDRKYFAKYSLSVYSYNAVVLDIVVVPASNIKVGLLWISNRQDMISKKLYIRIFSALKTLIWKRFNWKLQIFEEILKLRVKKLFVEFEA